MVLDRASLHLHFGYCHAFSGFMFSFHMPEPLYLLIAITIGSTFVSFLRRSIELTSFFLCFFFFAPGLSPSGVASIAVIYLLPPCCPVCCIAIFQPTFVYILHASFRLRCGRSLLLFPAHTHFSHISIDY